MEGAQTLERGLRLLALVAQSEDGLTVSQIARGLGVGRTVVYRLVVSLERYAMLRRDDAGKYRVGLGVLAIAGNLGYQVQLAVQPVLDELAARTRATARVVTTNESGCVVIAVAEPSAQHLHIAASVGACIEPTSAAGALLTGRSGISQSTVVHVATADKSVHSTATLVEAAGGVQLAVEVLLLVPPAEEIRLAVLKAAGDIVSAFR